MKYLGACLLVKGLTFKLEAHRWSDEVGSRADLNLRSSNLVRRIILLVYPVIIFDVFKERVHFAAKSHSGVTSKTANASIL